MINAEAEKRNDAEKIENLFSEQIIDAAIEVHRALGGPGLLESLYEDALFHELKLRHIPRTITSSRASNSQKQLFAQSYAS